MGDAPWFSSTWKIKFGVEMVNSKSWWIAKPVRQLVLGLRRSRELTRYILTLATLNRPGVLFIRLLKGIKIFIERKPFLGKIVIKVINNFPRLKMWLSWELNASKRSANVEGNNPGRYNQDTVKRIENIVTRIVDEVGSN